MTDILVDEKEKEGDQVRGGRRRFKIRWLRSRFSNLSGQSGGSPGRDRQVWLSRVATCKSLLL